LSQVYAYVTDHLRIYSFTSTRVLLPVTNFPMAVNIFPIKSPYHWHSSVHIGVVTLLFSNAVISNFPPKSRLNHVFHHNSAVSPNFSPFSCHKTQKGLAMTQTMQKDWHCRNDANDAKGLALPQRRKRTGTVATTQKDWHCRNDANDAKGLALPQ